MKRSFTVTELLVAIAIVVILAGILIGGMGYAGRRADDAKTISAIQELSAALEAYRAEKGYFPPCSTEPTKVEFVRNSDGTLSLKLGTATPIPFFDKNNKKAFIELPGAAEISDAWENPLYYRCPGQHNKASFDLFSCGRDGKHGYKTKKVSGVEHFDLDSDGNLKIDKEDETIDNISNWNNASQQ